MKMLVATLVAVALSVDSLTAAPKQGCQCENCFYLFGCYCGSATQQVKFEQPVKLPDYKWIRHTDGDTKEVALMVGDRQIGGWNFAKKQYLPIVDGKWSDKYCEPPVPAPIDASKIEMYVSPTPTYTSQPQYYYGSFQQSGGGCASGSCGSSSASGRWRR